MARNGKRKQPINEPSEVKSESRSSRRKTADTKASAKKNKESPKTIKGKPSSSRKASVKKEETDDAAKLDKPVIFKKEETPQMSLSDRIGQLLPKELEENEESDMSEEESEASDAIPLTIDRPPLDWLHEPSDNESSEDEDSMNWEAVEHTDTVKEDESEATPSINPSTPQEVFKDVEITFEAPKSQFRKSRYELELEKMVRELLHNAHVTCLVGHYMIRNKWCSRNDIKNLCKSVIPKHTNVALESNKSDIKASLRALSSWWRSYFQVTSLGLATHSYEVYENIEESTKLLLLENLSSMTEEEKSKLQATYGGDFIRTSKDFVECLLAKKGSRDSSTELFVAILRSVGMDARLVCSLQPVSFRVPIERSDESRNSSITTKGKQRVTDEQQGESSSSEVKFPFRTPRPKLSPPPDDAAQQAKITKTLTASSSKPPTVWAEVYDHVNMRWVTVDPIRGFIDDPKAMEPSASSKQNVLSYVIAFNTDCDGCVDVTRRYTSHWEKTNRLRGRELTKSEKEIGKRRWWDDFYDTIQRRRRGSKEKEEEEEFEALDEQEPIPTSISRFNNHRLYALERHLKKFEVLDPNSTVLGKIKGENIYPRSAVHPVSTTETWLKQGRSVKEGEQPIKYVNARAVTLEKKRAKEIARQEGEELQVGCYAYWQTEKYKPAKVVNGVVPKNSFGNVDLYQDDMCPVGAIHIPINGIAKIARKLEVDYAEAVVGFEFAKQRSIPTVSGIVVPAETEHMILEAWQEAKAHESKKAIAKQETEIYTRWKRLITSALLHERLNEAYGDPDA